MFYGNRQKKKLVDKVIKKTLIYGLDVFCWMKSTAVIQPGCLFTISFLQIKLKNVVEKL